MTTDEEQGRDICIQAASIRKDWQKEGNLEKAEIVFRDAIRQFPDYWLAHYGLGELLLLNAARAGTNSGATFDEGISEMKQASALAPTESAPLVKLACALAPVDFDAAREFYEKIPAETDDAADTLYPARWQGQDHFQFAIGAAERNADEIAVKAFCRAIQLNEDYAGRLMPQPPHANALWQSALRKLGRNEWFERRKADAEWILSGLSQSNVPSKTPISSITQPEAKKQGCFIATAVFGSDEAPQVLSLCVFRDRVLLQSFFGRMFVRTYYLASPFLTRIFSNSHTLKRVSRAALSRVVSYLDQQGH